MRVLTIILAAVAAGLAPTALADPYKNLAAQGYRWASVDGPYACRSKDPRHWQIPTKTSPHKGTAGRALTARMPVVQKTTCVRSASIPPT